VWMPWIEAEDEGRGGGEEDVAKGGMGLVVGEEREGEAIERLRGAGREGREGGKSMQRRK